MKKKITTLFFAFFALISLKAFAAEVDTNMAEMQAMDKITGRVSIIDVPVGGAVTFGTFSVVVRSCKTKTEEEAPENFAFVDVTDKSFNSEEYNIFKGWMLSSSPAVNAVEHPIYDVWLIKCFDGDVQKNMLLSSDELKARDNLPRLNEIQAQNAALMKNSLTDEENSVQNISFKDAIYREDVAPEDQNRNMEKIEGQPQNLLHIDESFEVDEDIVNMSSEDFEKALREEKEKLEIQESDVEKLEDKVRSNFEDEEFSKAISAELESLE